MGRSVRKETAVRQLGIDKDIMYMNVSRMHAVAVDEISSLEYVSIFRARLFHGPTTVQARSYAYHVLPGEVDVALTAVSVFLGLVDRDRAPSHLSVV